MAENNGKKDDGNSEFGRDLGLLHKLIVTGRKVGADTRFYTALADDTDFFGEIVPLVLHFEVLCRIEKCGVLGANDELAIKELEEVEKDQAFVCARQIPWTNYYGRIETVLAYEGGGFWNQADSRRLMDKLNVRWAESPKMFAGERLIASGYILALEKIGLRPEELVSFFEFLDNRVIGIRNFEKGEWRKRFRLAIQNAIKRRKIIDLLSTGSPESL